MRCHGAPHPTPTPTPPGSPAVHCPHPGARVLSLGNVIANNNVTKRIIVYKQSGNNTIMDNVASDIRDYDSASGASPRAHRHS